LVGTIIASFQTSAVSYLYYADRIYQINLAIAGIAIGTVILPKLSNYIQNEKKDEIMLIQNKALELSLFLSIPAAVALLIASEQIISALFGYGTFDEAGVKNSARALFYFSLGLPAFSLIKVFSSFFFARHNTKIPFYISVISVLLNIFISVYYFNRFGFIIIPIATSISSWFNSIILFIFLKKNNLFNFNLLFVNRFIRILIATSIMTIIFNYLINFFDTSMGYEQNFKAAYLIGVVLLGLISYLLIAVLIKAFKISDIKLKY
jgi:putative peptidoglycan lipid II flippase